MKLPHLWFTLLLSIGFAAGSVWAQSNTYYIAPSGDDAGPGTEARPWRTLARVQAAFDDLAPGSQFLFQRGGVYPGSLEIDYRVQGAAGAPIIFGAYGTGAEPIISGLIPISGWTTAGANRWQARCPQCAGRINLLLIDGQEQPLARYPNLDEGDEGYLYFDGAVGRSSLSDDALAGGLNWTGGELVIRSIAWVLDRYPILNHQGATLSLGQAMDDTNYDFEVGYGYFLQNHSAALDRDGEWVYDRTSQTITLYLNGDPNQRRIETTVVDKLVSLSNLSYVELRDLALYGGANYALDILNCEAVKLDRIQVLYGAADGINITNCTGLELGNSRIAQHLTHGLRVWNCDQCLIHHTTIEQIGRLAGMGRGGDGQYNGVGFDGDQSRFEYNTVQYIGYNGLGVSGSVNARYNLVQHYALVKVDSGGIYSYRTRDSQIIGNTVLYGLGSDAAIPWDSPAVNGIYIDDNSENIDVRDNVIGYIGASGIVLHNTRNVRVVNNVVFATGENGIFLNDDDLGDLESTDSLIENNRVLTADLSAPALRAQTSLSDESWLGRLGSIQNNRYCNLLRSNPISVAFQPQWFTRELSLAGWSSRYSYDSGSADCGIIYPTHRETSQPGPNRITNSTLDTSIDGWAGWPDSSLELRWDARWGGSLLLGHIGSDPNVLAYHDVGSVEAGKLYRVSFQAQAETDETLLDVYLQQAGPDYRWLSAPARLLINPADGSYSAYLTANESDPNVRLSLDLRRGDTTRRLWVDNIEVVPVEAVPLTADDMARLETNPSDTPRIVTLDEQPYIDLDGNQYPLGSIVTIPPFSGLILVREPMHTASLRLQVEPPSARIGEQVSVNLDVSGISQLYGLEAYCTVDAAVLTGARHLDGDIFNEGNSFFVDTDFQPDGHWYIAASLLRPAPAFSGDGRVFSLGYTVAGQGSTTITCEALAVDSDANMIPLQVEATTFTVNP